jgi:hypothetical protein
MYVSSSSICMYPPPPYVCILLLTRSATSPHRLLAHTHR